MDVIVKVRDPDENLEEKIKAYKVKKRIKTAVTILAFVFALISSYPVSYTHLTLPTT
mgnify:CR=1 FL=1